MPEGKKVSEANLKSRVDYFAIILLLISIISYWESFQSPFQFDDIESIVKNHYIRITDLGASSLFHAAFQDFRHNRPLTNLTLALNFYLNQLNPFGYHLVNFFFFIVTAF